MSMLSISTVFSPLTVNASAITQSDLANFNASMFSALNEKDSISVIKNPIKKNAQLTLINGIPLKQEVPTLLSGNHDAIQEIWAKIESSRLDVDYNLDPLIHVSFAEEDIIWVGDLPIYPFLSGDSKHYNSTFTFWHQVSHTVDKPSSIKNALSGYGDEHIDPNILLDELTADIFALMALMKQNDLSFSEIHAIALNLNANRLSTLLDSDGYDPMHLFTMPGINAALHFIAKSGGGSSMNLLSYEEVYNLSSNIALHSISTKLNLYVGQAFNAIHPDIMRDYIYKLSLSQRCYNCTKYDFKSFENNLSPMYLYPAAHKVMAEIFKLKPQLNELPEDDFNVAIYDLLDHLEGTPGMDDFSGAYYLFDNIVVHDLYENALYNSNEYQLLLTLIQKNVLSNANKSWIDRPYSEGPQVFDKFKKSRMEKIINALMPQD
jgi:hypothetical protein